jgi:hypothetical protein
MPSKVYSALIADVRCEKDAALGRGEVKLLCVGPANHAGLCSGQDIVPAIAQHCSQQWADIFVEVKLDDVRQFSSCEWGAEGAVMACISWSISSLWS